MKIEFFEETNFSYRRKQDLEKDLNLHWIARNMAGDKVGDIPAIFFSILLRRKVRLKKGSRLLWLPVKRHR